MASHVVLDSVHPPAAIAARAKITPISVPVAPKAALKPVLNWANVSSRT